MDEIDEVLRQVARQPQFSSVVWSEGQMWLKQSYRLRPEQVAEVLQRTSNAARLSVHREQGDTRVVVVETPLTSAEE